MRSVLTALPVLSAAAPLSAQPAPQLPPELTDPATAQRLAGAVQAVSNAFLNMRVGDIHAAMEGRPPSPAERNMTVRDMARRDDPDFDRHMQQRMAAIGPTMQRGMVELNRTLPLVMHDLEDAKRSLDRALSNLPDPDYPRR